MKKFNNVSEVTTKEVGQFIRLGGRGILDGLHGPACKRELYKIVAIQEDGMVLHPFGARKNKFLSCWKFDQACNVYSYTEFKATPKDLAL